MVKMNPFITSGYRSEKYFCDRIEETRFLTKQITNGNNVALISPRRLGKTGLIEHCFHQPEVKNNYYTFLIDIYATKNLQEFVFEFGKSILQGLKPQGRRYGKHFYPLYLPFVPESPLMKRAIPVESGNGRYQKPFSNIGRNFQLLEESGQNLPDRHR